MHNVRPEGVVYSQRTKGVFYATARAVFCSIPALVVVLNSPIFSQLTWHEATAPSFFTVRGGHGMLAHDNRLFIFSGQSETQSVSTNAFCTSDGVNWTLLADTVGFRRGAYYGCISFKGFIWITGGIKIEDG